MIYVTGDTHIPIDIKKLNIKNFPVQSTLSKNDYVIICGDFGGVWDNSKSDLWWLNWLDNKNFCTLFVDGNHENFDLLNAMPVENWCGGKIHRVKDSVLHLMRGQVYDIEGLKIFTFGGAASTDKEYRKEGKSWWSQEIPSVAEKQEAMNNLEAHNWKVDYVFSHTCARNVIEEYIQIKGISRPCYDPTEYFLESIKNKLSYTHWYFGHWHEDMMVTNNFRVVYEKVISLEAKASD